MLTFETILFFIAYTLGIATLIIQVICYLKKMEYLVTIVFVASFLLLITTVTLNDLNLILKNQVNALVNELVTFFMLLLGLTTPINIHAERTVKFASGINKILYIITGILFILQFVGYFIGMSEIMRGVIEFFMFASIGYSMMVILTSKPGMLIKHRDRIEKISSIVFFSIFPIFILIDVFYDKVTYIHDFIPEGTYLLLLFFIFLSILKLLDDIKRLTLFTPKNNVNQHVLDRFNITSREKEVLILIIKGKSYNQVCEELFISLPTVKTHITRIYKKMNIKNKVELINLLNINAEQPELVSQK